MLFRYTFQLFILYIMNGQTRETVTTNPDCSVGPQLVSDTPLCPTDLGPSPSTLQILPGPTPGSPFLFLRFFGGGVLH